MVDLSDSRSVEVHVVGFEFDPASGWLDVAGQVVDGSTRWSWQEACLTLDEAERLGKWLISACDGQPPEVDLLFTEQDVSVSFVAATPEAVTLDWWVPAFDGAKKEHSRVRLTTTRDALLKAAQDWHSELSALPNS